MLIALSALLVGGLLFGASRLSMRGDAKDKGWMSQQWLAEYRASHPL